MPLYEYQCGACGARFELIRKFSDPPLEVCTACGGGPVEKLVSSPAFQFKGSGWYITDYARKADPAGKSDGAAKADKAETPAVSDKADKKGDGKTPDSAKPAAPAATTKDN